MDKRDTATTLGTSGPLVAGLLAAFGATACCFGPLLLVVLGAGGAWAGRLERLAPYQPAFLGLTFIFLGLAGYRLYVKPRRCAEGDACAVPGVLKRQRAALWIVVGISALMFASPFLAPLFY